MKNIGFTAAQSFENSKNAEKHPWKEKYMKDATIFGKHTFLPIDFGHTKNDNTIVIGSSGTGKTYSFVEPNVLQCNANYVIADSKGTILSDIGASLKANGYDIQVLNLIDLNHSMTYNPLTYMKDELDVTQFAKQLVTSNADGIATSSNANGPFWDNSAIAMIQAIIFFVKEFLPKSEQNMNSVTKIFELLDKNAAEINKVLFTLGIKNTNYNIKNNVKKQDISDLLFEYARSKNPESPAVRSWDKISDIRKADTTWGGVWGEAGAALAKYSMANVQKLTASCQIDFKKLLEPKTAIFILYDDSNSSKNFISNSFYSQLMSFLYSEAFKLEDQKLPVKVRFFLDDFKNIVIPKFTDYLATARSRNLSICMMLQDEAQLNGKFGDNEAFSVIGNCNAYLLTGTIDLKMAQDASARFNLPPEKIRRLDEDAFLVDISGYTTKTKRYDYHNHPNYVDEKLSIYEMFKTPKAPKNYAGLAACLELSPFVTTKAIPYWKQAQDLQHELNVVADKSNDLKKRREAVNWIRATLPRLAKDPKLDELTKIYRYSPDNGGVSIGYDPRQVGHFAVSFLRKYPKPRKTKEI